MNGFMVVNFYLTLIDIIFIIAEICFSFLIIHFISKKLKRQIGILSIAQNIWTFALGILVLLAINYPLYSLGNIFQAQANSHFEPVGEYLISIFLVCLIFYMSIEVLKNFSKIKWSLFLVIIYFQIIFTAVIWIVKFISIDCTGCSADI